MAFGTSLVTLAIAQQADGLKDLDSAVVDRLIITASDEFRNECTGRVFDDELRTELYDGDNSRSLQLNEFPLTSITSITVTDIDGGTTVYTTTDFWIRKAGGLVEFRATIAGSFLKGLENVSVVYTGGFTTIPRPIQQAVVIMAGVLAGQEGGDIGLQSKQLGDFRVQFNTQVHAGKSPYGSFVQTVIARYNDRARSVRTAGDSRGTQTNLVW